MVVAADAVQMDPKALQRVEELFYNQIETGVHPGAHKMPQTCNPGGLLEQLFAVQQCSFHFLAFSDINHNSTDSL